MSSYIFVIDTDSHAGNFHREMTAYVTGIVGDCGGGEEFAEMFDNEVPLVDGDRLFVEYIEYRSYDDSGCRRPNACWPTKGWLRLDSRKAIRMEEWNQAKADAAYQKEMSDIYRTYLRQLENVDVGENGWTQESLDSARRKRQEDIDVAMNAKAPMIEPNNSVAIFFSQQPTEEMIALMKSRAASFAEAWRNNARQLDRPWEKKFALVIHGYRLIMETIVSTEINAWKA